MARNIEKKSCGCQTKFHTSSFSDVLMSLVLSNQPNDNNKSVCKDNFPVSDLVNYTVIESNQVRAEQLKHN